MISEVDHQEPSYESYTRDNNTREFTIASLQLCRKQITQNSFHQVVRCSSHLSLFLLNTLAVDMEAGHMKLDKILKTLSVFAFP